MASVCRTEQLRVCLGEFRGNTDYPMIVGARRFESHLVANDGEVCGGGDSGAATLRPCTTAARSRRSHSWCVKGEELSLEVLKLNYSSSADSRQ